MTDYRVTGFATEVLAEQHLAVRIDLVGGEALVLHAQFDEPLMILRVGVPEGGGRAVLPLTDHAVDAFLATVPAPDPERLARIRQLYGIFAAGVRRAADALVVREATDEQQREALLREVQRRCADEGATHDCGEWQHGMICGVCGRRLE